MVTKTLVMPGITKKPRKLDKIVIYDKTLTYSNAPHIQYLDSYKTDFVFVKDFPRVMSAMSEKMDKQDFREMLRCSIRTNLELYNDGELLDPRAERIIKEQWHGYLLDNFLGEAADNYIIRADYFVGDTPVLDIKNALQNNIALCTKALSSIKSDVDYKISRERNFMQWLMDYNKYIAFSGKYN